MIKDVVSTIAAKMGIQLAEITVVDGLTVGCLNTFLVNIATESQMVSTLVYQSELEEILTDFCYDHLEVKISSALSRLQ